MTDVQTSSELLTGWGNAMPSRADVAAVSDAEAAALIASHGPRGLLVRGLGRSYGDPAQNGGGTVLRLTDEQIDLDDSAGTVTVGGGVSIDVLLREIVPRGFFVPVTAGTRHVTVGGAIASDVHGKNHHIDGSFGRHVRSLRLLIADGSIVHLSPDNRAELFWATIGGMGLTGIILGATIALLPIETSRVRVEATRIPNLDELLAVMDEGDHRYRYSVAWVDLLATGDHLGRSVLGRGDHAAIDELSTRCAADPLAYHAGQRIAVPPVVPAPGVLNRLSVAAFNELWFRKAPRHTVRLETIPTFFHPLDSIGGWNRLYGRQGFLHARVIRIQCPCSHMHVHGLVDIPQVARRVARLERKRCKRLADRGVSASDIQHNSRPGPPDDSDDDVPGLVSDCTSSSSDDDFSDAPEVASDSAPELVSNSTTSA